MLPEPTLSFTLPSIHDGTPLECRVYHPRALIPLPGSPPWKRHAAIVAHPYAPLGGCYDDSVVELTAEPLLRLGYLVGTFNFRGAGKSGGRTSWSARPERGDYMSIAGFLVYYTHFLDPFRHLVPQQPQDEAPAAPALIMGGYSYGAMITTQLAPLDRILSEFAAPDVGSHAAEIRLRAQHLAEQQNDVLSKALAAKLEHSGQSSSPRSLAMRVGYSDADQRKSHDSRRSISLEEAEEKIKKGVHDLLARAKHGGKAAGNKPDKSEEPSRHVAEEHPTLEVVADLQPRRAAYLLISPLQGPVSHLTALNLKSSTVTSWFSRKSKAQRQDASNTDTSSEKDLEESNDKMLAETKLAENPTLAVFGDTDAFVAVKRLREWAKRVGSISGSQFRAHEVSTAGHFWIEEGVAVEVREHVAEFASGLLGGS